MASNSGGVLFVHHLDVTSPYQNTVPHYLAAEVSETRRVHVICRRLPDRRSGDDPLDAAVVHDIDTGTVPLLSGLLFVVASSLYALALGVRHRYEVVYAFQKTIVQGSLAAWVARARFVVGLQSVPVRQSADFRASLSMDRSVRERLRAVLSATYATAIGALLGRASAVVCLTEGIRDLTAEVYDVDLSDAHVIDMGVDVERFRPGDAADDRPSGPLSIVYVGTVGLNRGIGHLLEAIDELEAGEKPEVGDELEAGVELLVAGAGSDRHVSELQRKAERLGVDDRVEWTGFLAHERVPALLRDADVAVSPLRDIESFQVSFPAKVLEYLAAGCPVVATDIPSHRRLIEDGHNGYLYDGSTAGLVTALNECRTSDDRDDVRAAARATAEGYGWERIVAEHESVMFDGPAERASSRDRDPDSMLPARGD